MSEYESMTKEADQGAGEIQDQHRRVCHRHPCDGQELPLSLGKAAAAAL